MDLEDCFTPFEIEKRSFAIIEAELGSARPFSGPSWAVARRLVHTCADYSILDSLMLPEEAVEAGVAALLAGCTVFTDTEMARSGMPARRLDPLGVRVQCVTTLPGAAERAAELGQTRAKSGLEIAARGPSNPADGRDSRADAAAKGLAGSIVAVGNAPTALLALVEHLATAAPDEIPALVIAMPVGFVNAAESKELLLRQGKAQCLALRGRRGGSPLVAAAVNAMAELALARRDALLQPRPR